MSFERGGHGPLDYQPCQYDGSQVMFRGPKADLEAPFVLCLGGSETFGKFVAAPFPSRLGDRIGRQVVNLGVTNAGVDFYLNDPVARAAIRKAESIVLQVPGAANISNRFFQVHPRRNDRFIAASNTLRNIFHDVDFTEFHFTRHMLGALLARSEERFRGIVAELKAVWLARMRVLLQKVDAPVHLLWLGQRDPSAPDDFARGLGYDPLFVDAEMLAGLREHAVSQNLLIWRKESNGEGGARSRGLACEKSEMAAAALMPGPSDHEAVARLLAQVLA